MGYVGNIPAEKYSSLTQQTFSSPTGTSFTLSQSVTNSVDIALFIDNVRQDPSSYTASGTALTTSTISSPSTMYCLYNGKTTETVSPPAGSVDSSQLVSGSVDDSHISGLAASKLTGTVADSQIAAMASSKLTGVVAPANLGTGTASSSTFLNGAGAYAEAGGGKVLQVVQTHDVTTRSQTVSTSRVAITGLNVTITPASASSKIYITVRWTGESSVADNHNLTWGIRRDSTEVGNPAAASSRIVGLTNISQGYWNGNASDTPDNAYCDYMDSPSTTSAITYYGTVISSGSQTLYTNRGVVDGTGNTNERLTSTITCWEIGA